MLKTMQWKKNIVVGNTTGNIKPFSKTNQYEGTHPFGKPRPIKHYRRGRLMPGNEDRFVKSSVNQRAINDLMDTPAAFVQNSKDDTCKGPQLVANYYPNPKIDSSCDSCIVKGMFNEQDKARRRVRSGSRAIKGDYHTTLQDYRRSRCQTFEQKSYHFDEIDSNSNLGPNEYRAKCPSTKTIYDKEGNIIKEIRACDIVTYKPSNKKFAQDGSVQSSTRTLNAKKESIERTAATYRAHQKNIFYHHKMKSATCNKNTINKHKQNKTICIDLDL